MPDTWTPRAVPDMTIVKFTDAGHSPNVDAPAAVASALAAFWATLD